MANTQFCPPNGSLFVTCLSVYVSLASLGKTEIVSLSVKLDFRQLTIQMSNQK